MKENEKPFLDPDRFAYMLAWRDKHIEKQAQELCAHREERRLLDALLFYALFGISQTGEEEMRESVISKQGLREVLDAWRCLVEDGEDGYHLRFYPADSAVQAPMPDEDEDGNACQKA